MKKIHVRSAQPDDCAQFVSWELRTKGNQIDPKVLTYPSTSVRVAYDNDGPIIFLPIQRPLLLESLGVRPSTGTRKVAAALSTLLHDAVEGARLEGRGELYFIGTEPTLPKIAQDHGFEELPWKIYRMRVAEGIKWPQSEREPTGSNCIRRSIASLRKKWHDWRWELARRLLKQK